MKCVNLVAMQWRTLVLLTLLAIAAGCGPSYRYAKPGMTPEQRQRDESECEQQAMVSVSGGGFGGGGYSGGYIGRPSQVFDRDLFNRCMASRGYEIQEIRKGL